MPKFALTAEVTISMHCVVEAESAEAAKEMADEVPMMTLCHQCSGGAERHRSRGYDAPQWRTSGEFDGTPTVIEVQEVEEE